MKDTRTENTVAKFTNREIAQALVDELDSRDYILSHGEYGRPDYKARKVRGEDAYYIHATYYYYAGTLYAKQDGPLTEHCNELYGVI
jgi:hypothetical protein